MDRRFGFAGAAAVLMLVQVQVLAVDQRFGFAVAGAVLVFGLAAWIRRWPRRPNWPAWFS